MDPIVALGCGLVGEYVIHRLADDGHDVTAVDIRIPDSIQEREEIISIEQDAHRFIDSLSTPLVVVNMLPGRIGHIIRESLLKEGHNVVDLAFTEEELELALCACCWCADGGGCRKGGKVTLRKFLNFKRRMIAD